MKDSIFMIQLVAVSLIAADDVEPTAAAEGEETSTDVPSNSAVVNDTHKPQPSGSQGAISTPATSGIAGIVFDGFVERPSRYPLGYPAPNQAGYPAGYKTGAYPAGYLGGGYSQRYSSGGYSYGAYPAPYPTGAYLQANPAEYPSASYPVGYASGYPADPSYHVASPSGRPFRYPGYGYMRYGYHQQKPQPVSDIVIRTDKGDYIFSDPFVSTRLPVNQRQRFNHALPYPGDDYFY